MKWEKYSTKQLITCAGIAFVRSTKKMIARNSVAYRTVAVIMVFAMVLTMGFGTPMAIAVNGGTDSVITNIAALDDNVAVQHLPVGASESDIVFPSALGATLETYKEVLVEVVPEDTAEEEIEETEEADEENIESEEVVGEESATEEEATEEETTEEPAEVEDTEESTVPETVETPAEEAPVESEPVVETAPASEPEAVDPVASVIDILFPAITVKAAEAEEDSAATPEENSGEGEATAAEPTYAVETITTSAEITLTDITWTLDSEKSTTPVFDSNIEGAIYVYRANIPTEYAIDSSVPTITVIIGEKVEQNFEQSIVVDGVLITVKADKGVFPEGASLYARRATAEETEVAEEAVENERESENVAASYTFDIKVLDAAGNEIQPDTTKGTVKVSFTLEEVKNASLEADVYHITDANPQAPVAEKLETESIDSTVEAETTGFSFYTVEFTYNGVQYVLKGNTEVALSEVLEYIGIHGTVTEAYSSDENLFKVFYVRNNWRVAAVNPFTSLETLTVVVDGETYEIPVTDDPGNGTGQHMTYPSGSNSAESLAKAVLSEGADISDVVATGTVYKFENGTDDVGFEKGIILDNSSGTSVHDPDLEKLLDYPYGGHTSTLEFSLTATGKLLNFNYVFASAEFDQDPWYNDAFGLFVSVNGDPYENIALIDRTDGSKVPVTIINLRAGKSGTDMGEGQNKSPLTGEHSLFKSPSFQVNNGHINGVSIPFNAQKVVNVGDEVKIKFVICDVSDTAVNSYVFIEGESLSFDAPVTNVDYINEEINSLEPNSTYEITCGDKVYTFSLSDEKTIKLFGKDSDGTEYDFYGKAISIIRKGSGDTGDSEAQEITLKERPTYTDPFGELNQDAERPSEGNSNPIVTTKDSITITLDKDNKDVMGQVYRIDPSATEALDDNGWKNPESDGTITFTGLEDDTDYILRYRRPATKKVPSSEISDGITIRTCETVEVEIPNVNIESRYNGRPVDFNITTDPSDATIFYSTDLEGEFTSTVPTIKDAGTHTIYYKATKTGCRTTYGSFTVTIYKVNHEPVELTTDTNVPVQTTEEASIDVSKYVGTGAELIDYEIEGDLNDYIDNVDFIDGKIVYNITENTNGTTGVLKATIRSTNYYDYTITIPLISKKPVPVYVPTYTGGGSGPSTSSSTPTVLPKEELLPELLETKIGQEENKNDAQDKKPEITLVQNLIPEIDEDATATDGTTDIDGTLGKGKIIDKGDIWGDMTEDTKVKLLEKLDISGGEIIKTANLLDPVTSAKAELKAEENEKEAVEDKVPVKETPIALVMGEGAVVVTLELTDNTKANAGLADAKAVAKSILTEEQYAAVAAGSILEIKVEVTPLDKEIIPELDRQVIDDGVTQYVEQLPNLSMADYIDISMFMRIDDSDWNQLTDVDPIDIVIDIPENHKGLSDTYYIMRAHEGVSTLLEDKDSNPDTITISTGQFSTYALMYDEPQVAVKADIVSSTSTCKVCHRCPTLFGICYFVWLAIVAAAGISLVLYKSTRKQQEEE